MAESIASKALRGLGNALNLTGAREAPPGVELELPAQTVHDLTPYVRYGSAQVFGVGEDGWCGVAVRSEVIGAEFAKTTIGNWRDQIEDVFSFSASRLDRMALWIYGVTCDVVCGTSLDDIGACSINMDILSAISFGNPTIIQHTLFASDGSASQRVLQAGPLAVTLVNQVDTQWPVQWAGGRSIRFRNQTPNAINTVTFQWLLRCRIIPMGQAPLP